MTNHFDVFQSICCGHHYIENALVEVFTDINMDYGRVIVLDLLNVTIAFGTVDHDMLLKQLESWVIFSGTVVNWFKY